MAITWILAAHGSVGKILKVNEQDHEIFLQEEFFHPMTQKKTIEAGSDPLKYIKKPSLLPHAIDYSGDLEDHERQVFAKIMVDYLAKALAENKFNSLIIVASRNLLGAIRKAMPHSLSHVVAHQLNKDLLSQNLSDAELVEKIRNDLDLIHF